MKDPNKNYSEETLRRLQAESYERLRIELFNSIEQLLKDFDMTWDDLALRYCDGKLKILSMTGEELKAELGVAPITLEELNEIAHCFSAEVYVIFRPRAPFTNS